MSAPQLLIRDLAQVASPAGSGAPLRGEALRAIDVTARRLRALRRRAHRGDGTHARSRADRRRRGGDRRPRSLGDPGPRRLPHARVLRGRSRRGVLVAGRRSVVRGAACARRWHPLDGSGDARRGRGRPRRGARRARRLDAPRGDDDVRGQVGLRARPRDGARAAARDTRCGRRPDVAGGACGASGVRGRGRRRVPRLPARRRASGGGRGCRGGRCLPRARRVRRRPGTQVSQRVPGRRPRASPARRSVHGGGRDPAGGRARRAVGRPPRGDRPGWSRGARRERRHGCASSRRARSS